MTFGEYLKQKRLDKEITLRGFAKLVDISPVYLCDLEKGRKAAPSMEVMQKMVSKLALNKEESERFYDLAALEQTAKNPNTERSECFSERQPCDRFRSQNCKGSGRYGRRMAGFY